MDIRKGDKVYVRSGRKHFLGSTVLVDDDLISVRIKSNETQNFKPKEIFPTNFIDRLIDDYFQNRQNNNNRSSFEHNNERELKGAIKYLLVNTFFPGFQKKALEKLKGVPVISEEKILELLSK